MFSEQGSREIHLHLTSHMITWQVQATLPVDPPVIFWKTFLTSSASKVALKIETRKSIMCSTFNGMSSFRPYSGFPHHANVHSVGLKWSNVGSILTCYYCWMSLDVPFTTGSPDCLFLSRHASSTRQKHSRFNTFLAFFHEQLGKFTLSTCDRNQV